jgi:hypothetical protein
VGRTADDGLAATGLAATSATFEPWPHFLVDGAIAPARASRVHDEVLSLPMSTLDHAVSRRVAKFWPRDPLAAGSETAALLGELTSDQFLAALGSITSVSGLRADPSFSRAGVFIGRPGGFQRVHEDFPRHPRTKLFNRVVLMLYCSTWEPGWGGELELWPRDMAPPPLTIAPRLGRMVVFETSSATRHGVSEITAPETSPRVVVCCRYYSDEPPPRRPTRFIRTFRRPTERRRDAFPTLGDAMRRVRSESRVISRRVNR